MLVAGAHRMVQPGRALERQLPVEGRVDARCQLFRRWERVVVDTAGAELRAELGRCDRVQCRQPAMARLSEVSWWFDVDGDVAELLAHLVDCGDDARRVASQVVLVAQRRLERADVQESRLRRPADGRLDRAGAPVTTTLTGNGSVSSSSSSSRSGNRMSLITNGPTRSAYALARCSRCAATASAREVLAGGKIAASSTRLVRKLGTLGTSPTLRATHRFERATAERRAKS